MTTYERRRLVKRIAIAARAGASACRTINYGMICRVLKNRRLDFEMKRR